MKTIRLTLKEINDIVYVVIRKEMLNNLKVADKLIKAIFPQYKVNNEEYVGRDCIGRMMDRTIFNRFVIANKDLFIYRIMEIKDVNEKEARELFDFHKYDILTEGQKIVFQANKSIIENDILMGIRPWQLGMKSRIKYGKREKCLA